MAKPYIVVVRQLGGIGDILMMSCVYRGLREKYPHHKICCVASNLYAGGCVSDIVHHNPFVDEVHDMSPYEASTRETREVWNEHYGTGPLLEDDLWYQKADLRIDLNTCCMQYEMRATRTTKDVPLLPRYEIWCNQAGVVPSSYRPIYNITKQERQFAKEFWQEKGWDPKECVALSLNACDEKRAVSINQMARIAEGIMRMGLRPVTIDATLKIEGCDYIIGKRIIELMAIMEPMRLCVSVDSGVLHMAGTLDVPVIGLFGPTDQDMRMRLYRGAAIDSSKLMPCAPCMYEYPCLNQRNPDKQFECLKKIRADVVCEEIRRWKDATA